MHLATYLEEKGVSIAAFAETIAVSHEAVRRYCKGSRRPEWDVLVRITAATDGAVQANDFVNGKTEQAS